MPDQLVGWVSWIGIVVVDLEAQRAYYRDVLGLKELGRADGFVWFDMGWPNLLELKDSPIVPDMKPGVQIGFTVGDVSISRQALIDRGAHPIDEISGGPKSGGFWCTFNDPEGNIFEIGHRLGPPWPTNQE